MRFKKELKERLKRIEAYMDFLRDDVSGAKVLREEVRDLRATNKDLLDRLMSRNFEELKTYETTNDSTYKYTNLPPEEDESNAGEVM